MSSKASSRVLTALTLLSLAATPVVCSVQGVPCVGPACKRCYSGCHCSGSTPYCLHDISAATSHCVNGHARTMMPPLFFVHMPKTGGTTFRYAAVDVLGQDSVCMDYENGLLPKSNWTVVHKEPGDMFINPSKTRCRMLSGHVQVEKYVIDFGLRRTAVFMREPIQRFVSWYHHAQRVSAYNGTFEDFLEGFRRADKKVGPGDLMSRRVNSPEIPLAAFGFVGLTEMYAESMRIFNDAYALDLQYGRQNADPHPVLPPEADDPAIVEEFKKDTGLFNQAQALLMERLRILDACSPYAHGGVDAVENGVVQGWAWWAHSDEEVEVAIVVGDTLAGYARCGKRHQLGKWGVPRDGEIGFEFKLPSQPLAGEVCCFVRGTGQYLGPGLRDDLLVTNASHPCSAGVALSEPLD